MSGHRPEERPLDADAGPTAVEQHLGDRLAALVDGELGHDSRERVLSHLATCWSCKAEADAQRQLKNVFADAAPPPPSDGLMARLQGLPAAPAAVGESEAARERAPDPLRSGTAQRMAAGARRSPWDFDYLSPGRSGMPRAALGPERGFRIHEMERSASRGRRFAFAAAGAFSLAALAIGGALSSGGVTSGPTASSGDGSSATPVRASSGSSNTARDTRRRGSVPEQQREGLGVMSASNPVSAPSPVSVPSAGARESRHATDAQASDLRTFAGRQPEPEAAPEASPPAPVQSLSTPLLSELWRHHHPQLDARGVSSPRLMSHGQAPQPRDAAHAEEGLRSTATSASTAPAPNPVTPGGIPAR